MSLSSASSLERNDTSEEFLDDFENLGDQSQNGVLQNKNPVATATRMRMQSFLNETMDWAGIGLAGIAKHYDFYFYRLSVSMKFCDGRIECKIKQKSPNSEKRIFFLYFIADFGQH